MKKSGAIIFTSLIIASVGSQAATRIISNDPLNYGINATSLHQWHIGAEIVTATREVKIGGRRQDLDAEQYLSYASYDLFKHLSLYAAAGYGEGKVGMEKDRSGSFAFGGGARMLLIDHDLLDTGPYLDTVRLSASSSIMFMASEYQSDDISWRELTGSLTLSLVNDVRGNQTYWFESIGIYGGPAFQVLSSDDFDQKGEYIGARAGIEMYTTRKTSLDLSYQYFDNDRLITGALNIDL